MAFLAVDLSPSIYKEMFWSSHAGSKIVINDIASDKIE